MGNPDLQNYLKAGLAIIDPDYQTTEWDRLIPQAEVTLNLSRASRVNPRLSAYGYIFGKFDFNSTLMAPPGKICVPSQAGPKIYMGTSRGARMDNRSNTSSLQMPYILISKNQNGRASRDIYVLSKFHPFPKILNRRLLKIGDK